MPTNTIIEQCQQIADRAKQASTALAIASTLAKNAWLTASAQSLLDHSQAILEANARDIAAAPGFGLTAANIDRLTLTPARIQAMAEGLKQVASLPDPIGEVREGGIRPNGLQVLKVGVPLGVIFFLYESRPNVTVDAAALCVKSGNAVILRGGKEAAHSNAILLQLLQEQLPKHGLPIDAVQAAPAGDREVVGHLLKLGHYIDLVIPRGGESLIRRVAAEATMPVLKHYQGNCHVYVDVDADLDMATKIIINAKCSRPGVCNATESLLIHRDIAVNYLPILAQALTAKGVEIRGCAESCKLVAGVCDPGSKTGLTEASYNSVIKPATEKDFGEEFLDLIISVKVVSDVNEAIIHINKYGSKHTDAIITSNYSTSRKFIAAVDSAAVMVNASTRFNDGFELGMGAEIGISTDKFHARGPCGLRELTSYKYVVTGDGQIR